MAFHLRRPCSTVLAAVLAVAAPGVSAQTPLNFISVDGFERLQAMRIDTLALRDPHLYAGVSFLCTDITGTLNDNIASELNGDADSDGILDNSPMLLFRPLRINDRPGLARVGSGDCTSPVTGTSCQASATAPLPAPYESRVVGTCHAPLPGTVRPYTPAVEPSVGACIAADAEGIDLGLGDIASLLRDPRIGASRRDSPTPGLGSGLLSGFVTEAAANALIVEVPIFGQVPLSSLLPGGSGNCASHSDKDTHEGQSGWWFYFNFTASEVPWQE